MSKDTERTSRAKVTGPSRRSFLAAVPSLSLAAAGLTTSPASAACEAQAGKPNEPVYRCTDHIQRFYDRSRF